MKAARNENGTVSRPASGGPERHINHSGHISVAAHASSRQKIEVKLALLEHWARNGIPWKQTEADDFVFDQAGQKVLEYFPDSENAVRRWKAECNTPGVVMRALQKLAEQGAITQDHLASFDSYDAAALSPGGIRRMRDVAERAYYLTLKDNVSRALTALKIIAKRQLEGENKAEVIADLREQLRIMHLQRQSAAQQALADRKRLRSLLAEWKMAKAGYESSANEFKRLIDEKDREIASLNGHISTLLKEREKIVGLSAFKESKDGE